jgi:hypothetical protein
MSNLPKGWKETELGQIVEIEMEVLHLQVMKIIEWRYFLDNSKRFIKF